MKQKMMFFSLIMLFSVMAYSQTTFHGKVVDAKSGEPVRGVHISLLGFFKSTVTDANGRFAFKRLSEDSYTLTFSHISYTDLEKKIALAEGDTAVMMFLLHEAVRVSEAYIVSAVRSEQQVTGAQQIVGKAELRSNNMGMDLPFLISTTPSVVSTSDAGHGVGYTGMRIRGTDQNRINVTINGVPLNNLESHSVYWVDLPDFAGSVEDIQIQRGVGTSTNGAGAFGGSVNIRTEKLNTLPYASVNFVGGSFNTVKKSLNFGSGLVSDMFAFDGRFSGISSDGYIDRASAALSSYYLSAGYYGKRTMLKAVLMSGKEVTYQAWDGIPSEILDTNRTWNGQGLYTDQEGNIRFYDQQVDDYRQDHYQLHLVHSLNARWTVNSTVFLTQGIGFYESYRTNRKFSNFGLPAVVYGFDTIHRTDMITRKWLDNDFYGITGSVVRNINKSTFTAGGAAMMYQGDHFGTLVWLRDPGVVAKDHEWYRGDGKKKDANVFVKYLHHFSSGWMVFVDMQCRGIDYTITGIDDDLRDISQRHRYLFFNPKAGFSLRHNDIHQSNLMVGVANREPNRSNFTDAGANGSMPTSERLFNIELGHDVSFTKVAVAANFYMMYYHDQLVLTGEINDVGSPVMTNVDQSYRTGLELMLKWQIHPLLLWEGNVTMSQNRIFEFAAFVDDWDTWEQREEYIGSTKIAFSPSVIANSLLKISPLNNISVLLINQYVGSQYLDNTGSGDRMLDPWFITNIHLQYCFPENKIKDLRFNLMLNNIFNVEYESNGWVYRYYETGEHKTTDGLFSQAGFHLLGGLTFSF